MHMQESGDVERPVDHDAESHREGVIAADDTGLVQQQVVLEVELEDEAGIGSP
jgi:hypothetical protein